MTKDRSDAGLAGRLLDAQVAFHLAGLDEERLPETVVRLTENALRLGDTLSLAEAVEPAVIETIVLRALAAVPASAAVAAIVELVTDVVYDGPQTPYPLGEVIARERVEALIDEFLDATPALERGLDRLSDNPQVGVVASRFMGRIVGEVLAANKAVADRVPGLGSLMSFGVGAASRMVGAADKQLEGLIGDTVGRGGAFAVRRLNRILIETLRDPATRGAALEVWDQLAATQITGLAPDVARAEVDRIVGSGHDLVVETLAGERVAELAATITAAFFERFGAYTASGLLDELDIDRADIVADAVRIAPAIVAGLRESGRLEELIRAELAPFYESAEVRDLLS